MCRKPVEVDFEKIIETILERRRQILQKVDDILENTRKNVAKQEAAGERAETSSDSAIISDMSDIQGDSSSAVSNTAEVLRNTNQAMEESDQSNLPQSISSSSPDVSRPLYFPEELKETSFLPTSIPSFSLQCRGSSERGHQSTARLNLNLFDETQLHNPRPLSERVRIACRLKFDNTLVTINYRHEEIEENSTNTNLSPTGGNLYVILLFDEGAYE